MLEIKDLVAGYEQRMLIRNLFFSLPEPAFVAIVGHNGGGKTTFFKALTGQLPYQGQVRFNGSNFKELPRQAASNILSYLPQKNSVSFPIPVRDLAVMGLIRKKRFLENYNTADYQQVDQLLVELEIAHLAHRDFTELSGGEQQLIWLAQLMLQDTRLCLLDEPTQQLDVYHKKHVFQLMTDWVNQRQKTVLCITHDLPNLYGHKGYLLNLSKPQPQLEVLTSATIQDNILFLEQKLG
ncbi:ABC transporter ATP-binding protein [Adhaeribacter radiodurans]|uniref:ABC transporter ATP-binding protein n=1 Tax=Adhaeribacter radiodurans TaxID=2745197 RepID=A0A7L7LBJ4_9BACT|nr:ABC transporter ATP-binding protein [Adhaeribacter radiodurans]QMU30218.1 ABC transporter ATP-binding protein [Adhaeribacter radiodurans]